MVQILQLISKFNKAILSVIEYFFRIWSFIDIFRKVIWIVSLNGEKGITITNTFQKFLDEANLKQNKVWVDKGKKFYNRSMESWLQDNDIEMYSAHNIFIVAKRFVITLKNKI